jgi:hypothetical protein
MSIDTKKMLKEIKLLQKKWNAENGVHLRENRLHESRDRGFPISVVYLRR